MRYVLALLLVCMPGTVFAYDRDMGDRIDRYRGIVDLFRMDATLGYDAVRASVALEAARDLADKAHRVVVERKVELAALKRGQRLGVRRLPHPAFPEADTLATWTVELALTVAGGDADASYRDSVSARAADGALKEFADAARRAYDRINLNPFSSGVGLELYGIALLSTQALCYELEFVTELLGGNEPGVGVIELTVPESILATVLGLIEEYDIRPSTHYTTDLVPQTSSIIPANPLIRR